MLEWIQMFISDRPLIQLLDILMVWYLIYKLLIYARGTQMMNLLKGVGIFIVIKFMSSLIGLQTIDWLLGQVLAWGVVAAIIVFQPELRRALEILGRNLSGMRSKGQNQSKKMIDDLIFALQYMSKRKIGALIAVELQDGLADIISTGVPLDSDISNQLLINIFIPNTPLHDGAVVIRDHRIAAASCYLPLSENNAIPKELGTRHRAAIGLSEVSDAVVLIVSEETGDISIVKDNQLNRGVEPKQLQYLLTSYLQVDQVVGESSRDPWSMVRRFLTGGGRDE